MNNPFSSGGVVSGEMFRYRETTIVLDLHLQIHWI
jgi:hypothetical protein